MGIGRISVAAGALTALVMAVGTSAASADPSLNCPLPVVTSKGTLTAAVVDTSVTGELDATGCDIGAYYDSAGTGAAVAGADVHGAQSYGVFVDGIRGDTHVDVTNSSIHDIGDTPFDGVQRGIAVYYYGFGTPGTVSGNVTGDSISRYQKGGVTVNGSNASANVTGNQVTGLGPVSFIAQNGIQFGFGSSGVASSNEIDANNYTGCSNKDAAKTGCTPFVSAGLLLYDVDPSQVSRSQNHYRDDQRNELVDPTAEVDAHSS